MLLFLKPRKKKKIKGEGNKKLETLIRRRTAFASRAGSAATAPASAALGLGWGRQHGQDPQGFLQQKRVGMLPLVLGFASASLLHLGERPILPPSIPRAEEGGHGVVPAPVSGDGLAQGPWNSFANCPPSKTQLEEAWLQPEAPSAGKGLGRGWDTASPPPPPAGSREPFSIT